MRIVEIRLEELCRRTVPVGRVGENLRTRVLFDCSSVFAEYPAAAACLTVRPPGGEAYPAAVSRSGDMVIWDVRDSDLASPGAGNFQLTFAVDGVVAKSCIGQTYVGDSLLPSGDVPAPVEDWLLRAETALGDIPREIEDALAAARILSLPSGGSPGSLLAKRSGEDGDAGWIMPADAAEQDNTRPITSAAVYTEIGNINALLATI